MTLRCVLSRISFIMLNDWADLSVLAHLYKVFAEVHVSWEEGGVGLERNMWIRTAFLIC